MPNFLKSILLGAFIILTFFPSLSIFAQNQKTEIASLDSAEGSVEAQQNGENDFKAIEVGAKFYARDTIRTTKNARAAILFASGTILRLAPGTSLQFQGIDTTNDKAEKISMERGQAYFFEREPSQFPVIDTPTVTTAVRGTEFSIKVDEKTTEVAVLNGVVECSNSFGTSVATDNEIMTTNLGQAPTKAILVNPIDAVQWTLYYPELIDFSKVNFGPSSQAIEESQKLLAVGRVEEANKILSELSASVKNLENSKNKDHLQSLLLSQKSIIATVRNQKDEALKLAKESWATDKNASAALAAAYSLQSAGRLEEANEWLTEAHELNPEDAYILARQAEMQLSFGNVEEATIKSQAALKISEDDSYALSVHGFVNLIKDERQTAIEAFEKSIKINPSSALAYLGLGLVQIRKGELAVGRALLEKAVALEPRTAIFRSYLGKAFFEEDREELSIKEYNHAIEIDDQDPTPYLYRAFANLSGNKTVAALEDVERSIELNNNRAVYRSSLLLDQDLGARSAGLAQVFTELGFSQAARVEAIKSINRDYSNYSGHRMLSDSYNTIFLNDAGISESQISTLLAPLSFNLFSQGSAVASFNEYNSLFDRDQSEIELAGEFQSEDNFILPEVRAFGKKEKFGYLISYDGLFTDEAGVGNDSQRSRGRTALQYQPTYQDLFLLDASTLYRKAVDDRTAPDEIDFDDYVLSLGYRHYFGPDSTLIMQSSLSDQRSRSIASSAEREISLTQEFQKELSEFSDLLIIDDSAREVVKSIRNSLQVIHNTTPATFVLGTQVYSANAKREEQSPVLEDQEEVFTDLDYNLESFGYNRLTSIDLYSYSTWHLASWADLSAGASFSQLEIEEREITPFTDDTYSKSHLSPKAGLTLYPSDSLTLRSAFFETIRKSSLEDQAALEPTLVGGINQRFTDLSGTFGRSFGLGADYKAAASTYIGVEGLKRHLVNDIRPAQSTVYLNYDDFTAKNDVVLQDSAQLHQDQNIIRAYLNQVLSERWVATLNYEWSKLERTDPEIPQDLDFNKIALGLRYIDPSGWYLLGEATLRHQSRFGSDFNEDGSDNFWLVDSAIGYRIPDRKGAIELKLANILDEDFEYDQSQGQEDFVRSDFNAILAFRLRY